MRNYLGRKSKKDVVFKEAVNIATSCKLYKIVNQLELALNDRVVCKGKVFCKSHALLPLFLEIGFRFGRNIIELYILNSFGDCIMYIFRSLK